MKKLSSCLLAVLLLLYALPFNARASEDSPQEKSAVLLVCDEANGRSETEALIRACGKEVDSVSEADYSTALLDGYSYLVTTINVAYKDAATKGIPTICLGENCLPFDGVDTVFLESKQLTLGLDGHSQQVFVNSANLAEYSKSGGSTYGQVALSDGQSFPFAVVGPNTAFVPWFQSSGLSIIMLGGLMRQFFGAKNDTDGKMYVLIDEVYPYSDLDMLRKTAAVFSESGIPFIVRIMPTYDNLDYPAFQRYTQALLYVQSKGGSVVLHDPIVQKDEQEREALSDKLARIKTALSNAGIILLASGNMPLTISLDDIINIRNEGKGFGTFPIDTMINLSLPASEDELSKTADQLNGAWLTLTSYKENYSIGNTTYVEKPIDTNFQYRSEQKTSLKSFFNSAGFVLLLVVGILLLIFILMFIRGNRIYKRKFYKKQRKPAMTVMDVIMLFSLICIWFLLFVNVFLIIGGYLYYVETVKYKSPDLEEYPMISVLIPAHNESIVITRTVYAMLDFDYPHDRYEIIVINDNSSDNSSELLKRICDNNPGRNLKIINTDSKTGGKGKSNALNIGFNESVGKYIVVYDADNTPASDALRLLAAEIESNPVLGAVIGKFRTRNKDANLLTRFINIETLAFQWMAQAGRWKFLKLCTIPGTNFIIRREILEQIGGWDINAIAEDTEISFRIYKMGYYIKFLPQAVTWEQEPQTMSVWFKQRTRWVKGNIYVLIKNLPLMFDRSAGQLRFDIWYFFSTYFVLLVALVCSDGIFLLNTNGWAHTTLQGFSMLLWLMAIVLFIIGTLITVITEKGELSFTNVCVILLMYFTYSKIWMIVAIYGIIQYIEDKALKREVKWYKTERFQ